MKLLAHAFAALILIFLATCFVVGTLGLWHLAFGWPH